MSTAQTYINQVKDLDLTNFDLSSYKLLASPLTGNTYGVPHQDFITKVPEPGVLTLLGLGPRCSRHHTEAHEVSFPNMT